VRAAKSSGLRSGRALFAAAWRWITANVGHVEHLEDMLCHVASPDLSIQDLLAISGISSGGAVASQAAPVLQQLLAAREAAATAAATVAPAEAPAAAPARALSGPAQLPVGLMTTHPQALQMPVPPQGLQMLTALLQQQGGAALPPDQVAAFLAAATSAAAASPPIAALTPLGDSPRASPAAGLASSAPPSPSPAGAASGTPFYGAAGAPPSPLSEQGDDEAGGARMKREHSAGELPRLRARPSSRAAAAGGVFSQRNQPLKGVCQVDGCYCDLST
jgi:hypothetical protein